MFAVLSWGSWLRTFERRDGYELARRVIGVRYESARSPDSRPIVLGTRADRFFSSEKVHGKLMFDRRVIMLLTLVRSRGRPLSQRNRRPRCRPVTV